MTIRSTFITIVVTVAVVLTLQGFVLLSYYHEYLQATQRMQAANGLIRDLLNRRFFLMEYLLRNDDSSRVVWLDVTGVIENKVSTYEDMLETPDIQAVQGVLTSSKQNFLILVALRQQAAATGIQSTTRDQETALISGLLEDEQTAAGHLNNIIESERAQAGKAQSSMLALSLVIFALFVLLALILFFFVQRNIIHPLTRLGAVALSFAARDFGMRVHIDSKDEVGTVAAAFNQMATELESYHADLHRIIEQKDLLAQRTRELDVQKNKFIGAASHELKTPLTAVSLYAEMLIALARKQNDGESGKIATELHAQAQELNALINDLLDIARLQEGRLPMQFETIVLNECVQKAIETVRGASDHVLRYDDTNRIVAYGDRRKITQVIINLLVNAVKYSPDARQVDITIREQDGQAQVCVKDYGIGIEPEEQEKIFQQFYRGTGMNESTYPGMGIGLYFAKEVLTYHSGTIWVESIKGKGASFCFALPQRQPLALGPGQSLQ